jgi:hypothetical protein
MSEPIFEIDTAYQFYMSLLVKHLENKGQYKVAKLVKQSGFRIHSGYDYDNLDGGTYGHKVTLIVNSDIFLDIIDFRDKYDEIIKIELNKIYIKENEYIAAINIIPADGTFNILNQTISVYTQNKLPLVTDVDLDRIWGNKIGLKIFISHRDIDKKEASLIQSKLLKFNICSFVAHEDIKATEEWIKEILKALQSMDIFIAYITNEFFNSKWTNQEIGFALGRNIPIIPIKNKINPDGFISILQAKPYNETKFTLDFFSLLLDSQIIHTDIRSKLINCLITSLENSCSWNDSEIIFRAFNHINTMKNEQIDKIIEYFNKNNNISECIYVSGYDTYGRKKSNGVFCNQLKKWTGKEYEIKYARGKVYIQEINLPHSISFPTTSDVPF